MTDQLREDELARLRAEFDALRADVDRARHRRRRMWRLRPVLLAALLVALIPLATLAANPFGDLNPGSVHNANIDAIYNAGITKGCDPDVAYCPNGLVTREEMASFLARTAGLGANPPVANAQTAQSAVTAQTATTAESVANGAITPDKLSAVGSASGQVLTSTGGGVAWQDAPIGGSTVGDPPRLAFSDDDLTSTLTNNVLADIVKVTIVVPGTAPQVVAVRGTVGLLGQPSGGHVRAYLVESTGAVSPAFNYLYQNGTADVGIVVAVDWVFYALPGAHTYYLRAMPSGLAGPVSILYPRLTATTHASFTGVSGTP